LPGLKWDESPTDICLKIRENGSQQSLFDKVGVLLNQKVLEQKKCRQCGQLIPTNAPKTKCHYHSGSPRADLAVFRAHHFADIHGKDKQKITSFILNNVENDGPWWYWTCCQAKGRAARGCVSADHCLENATT
jgi:hypothetical protein